VAETKGLIPDIKKKAREVQATIEKRRMPSLRFPLRRRSASSPSAR
jgi:hypothetical protein